MTSHNNNEERIEPWRVQGYVSLALEGKPDGEGSKALLRLFCERAKKLKFPTSPFPEPLLVLMISAFEKYLSGEEKDLEKSLGLKRRGKPPGPEIQKRNIEIATEVLRLKLDDKPLTPSRESDGAFFMIATRYGLSEQEARDIFYEHQNMARAVICRERLLQDDDSA